MGLLFAGFCREVSKRLRRPGRRRPPTSKAISTQLFSKFLAENCILAMVRMEGEAKARLG